MNQKRNVFVAVVATLILWRAIDVLTDHPECIASVIQYPRPDAIIRFIVETSARSLVILALALLGLLFSSFFVGRRLTRSPRFLAAAVFTLVVLFGATVRVRHLTFETSAAPSFTVTEFLFPWQEREVNLAGFQPGEAVICDVSDYICYGLAYYSGQRTHRLAGIFCPSIPLDSR